MTEIGQKTSQLTYPPGEGQVADVLLGREAFVESAPGLALRAEVVPVPASRLVNLVPEALGQPIATVDRLGQIAAQLEEPAAGVGRFGLLATSPAKQPVNHVHREVVREPIEWSLREKQILPSRESLIELG